MAGKLMYPNLEEDKIYTHELSSNSLMSISFTYSSINDKKQQLLIDISKEIPMEVTELVYEEKVINGITYKVSYSLNSDHLFGFTYHQDVNGLTYIVPVPGANTTLTINYVASLNKNADGSQSFSF